MLLINNINTNIHKINKKLSKSIMLFKVKINILKNKINNNNLILNNIDKKDLNKVEIKYFLIKIVINLI